MLDSAAGWQGGNSVRLIFCLTLAMAAMGSSAAEVYRSLAADGTVIYSDRPSSIDAEPIIIATGRPATPAPRSVTARPETFGAAATAESTTEPVQRDPTPAERAEDRARNCATAQERVERYYTAHRLYRTLPNGEREYLDDAAIDEARARAAADVENWCD
jgi:hypothetical protein